MGPGEPCRVGACASLTGFNRLGRCRERPGGLRHVILRVAIFDPAGAGCVVSEHTANRADAAAGRIGSEATARFC